MRWLKPFSLWGAGLGYLEAELNGECNVGEPI